MSTSRFRHFCLDCQYDLTGLEEHRCPECGKEFDSADPETWTTDASPGGMKARGCKLMLFSGVMFLIYLLLSIVGLVLGFALLMKLLS